MNTFKCTLRSRSKYSGVPTKFDNRKIILVIAQRPRKKPALPIKYSWRKLVIIYFENFYRIVWKTHLLLSESETWKSCGTRVLRMKFILENLRLQVLFTLLVIFAVSDLFFILWAYFISRGCTNDWMFFYLVRWAKVSSAWDLLRFSTRNEDFQVSRGVRTGVPSRMYNRAGGVFCAGMTIRASLAGFYIERETKINPALLSLSLSPPPLHLPLPPPPPTHHDFDAWRCPDWPIAEFLCYLGFNEATRNFKWCGFFVTPLVRAYYQYLEKSQIACIGPTGLFALLHDSRKNYHFIIFSSDFITYN